MIFLTGDTHGGVDSKKLFSGPAVEKQLTKDDFLIILGDFGFIWKNTPDDAEQYWLAELEKLPWTTLFIDGNHENFSRLNSYPVENWHGGKIHRINDSVIHLMRGQVFDIDGKTFFTFGGAKSIDAALRTEGISWWPEEQANYAEIEEGFDNLLVHHDKVDYVLTHTCVTEVCNLIVNGFGGGYHDPDPMTKVLDSYRLAIDFQKWYFAHWHIDKNFGRYECLYNKIVEVA